jgi:heme/copper-type cytochrome/quinol oxidase subunit 2
LIALAAAVVVVVIVIVIIFFNIYSYIIYAFLSVLDVDIVCINLSVKDNTRKKAEIQATELQYIYICLYTHI